MKILKKIVYRQMNKFAKTAILLLILLSIIFAAKAVKMLPLFGNSPTAFGRDALLQKLAEELIVECSKITSSVTSCYDEKIPRVIHTPHNLSMEEAFRVIRIIQSKDDRYWFCHAAGHKLSTIEYQKDPSEWKNIMTRCEAGICSNGCLHGALQEHFNSESLTEEQVKELLPDLQTLCEARDNWNPTDQQTSSCYHELGHLSLYLTNSNIKQSASICDTVALKPDGRNYLQTCYEGIFMQIFEPREPEDFNLIYRLIPLKERLKQCDQYTLGIEKGSCWKIGWENQTASFCNQFEEDLRGACFREAWVINDKQIETPEGIVKYCSYSNDPNEQRKCYNKLFYTLMSKFDFNTEFMKKLCQEMPQDIMGQCFANTASRLVETDKSLVDRAIQICVFSSRFNVEDECYNELVYYAGTISLKKSPEALAMCEKLPQPWQNRCRSTQQL